MDVRWACLTWQSDAQDCGHDAVNDEALFSSMARRGEPPARPPTGVTGLAFDERMTMHSEQSSAPHPERPDRIRAVIARLQASGLAGVLGSLHPNPSPSQSTQQSLPLGHCTAARSLHLSCLQFPSHAGYGGESEI